MRISDWSSDVCSSDLDRDLVAAGVGDGVVFVRRDQDAGAAGTGMHAAGGAEAETLAVAFEQLVLGDFQFAVPDALYAPQAAVVVDRKSPSLNSSHYCAPRLPSSA